MWKGHLNISLVDRRSLGDFWANRFLRRKCYECCLELLKKRIILLTTQECSREEEVFDITQSISISKKTFQVLNSRVLFCFCNVQLGLLGNDNKYTNELKLITSFTWCLLILCIPHCFIKRIQCRNVNLRIRFKAAEESVKYHQIIQRCKQY